MSVKLRTNLHIYFPLFYRLKEWCYNNSTSTSMYTTSIRFSHVLHMATKYTTHLWWTFKEFPQKSSIWSVYFYHHAWQSVWWWCNSTYNLHSPPENSPEVSNYSHSNCWYIAMNTTFECLPPPLNCGHNHLAKMTNSIASCNVLTN